MFYDGLAVDHVIFYSKGKVLHKGRSSFFEDQETNQDITNIKINKPKRANKLNLNREDNFFIIGRRQYNFDKGYIFYINCDLENIKVEETEFKEKFKSDFHSTQYKYKLITANENIFTRYKTRLDEKENLIYDEIEVNSFKVFDEMKEVNTKLGNKRDKIVIALKKINDLGRYEVEKMLKVVNITIKRRVKE